MNLLDTVRAFIVAEAKLHKTYGSTATCSGGIGGSALTMHCSVTCHNPKHAEDLQEYTEAKGALYKAMREAPGE